jgi:diacylglycerol kinase family enzyme
MQHFTILNQNARNYSTAAEKQIRELTTSTEHLDGLVLSTISIKQLRIFLHEQEPLQPDFLGLGGGDGTLGDTLSAVREVWGYIPDTIIPYAMGTMNNWAFPSFSHLPRFLGGQTKPSGVAKHLSEVLAQDKLPSTTELGLFGVNDKCAMNIGFSVIPQLLWLYDGRTIAQYYATQNGSPIPPRNNHQSGLFRAVRTATLSFLGASGINREVSSYLNETASMKIYVDGQRKELQGNPTAVLISSYEQLNLGVSQPLPKPLPEARAEPGKMQVLISYLQPHEIASPRSLFKLFRGQHLDKTDYFHCTSLQVQSTNGRKLPYQRDGEAAQAQECEISYLQPLKFICAGSKNHSD